MAKKEVVKKETDRVIDFLSDTRDGRYTLEKPDLTQISYARMDIQGGDSSIFFNDTIDDVILYGVSY